MLRLFQFYTPPLERKRKKDDCVHFSDMNISKRLHGPAKSNRHFPPTNVASVLFDYKINKSNQFWTLSMDSHNVDLIFKLKWQTPSNRWNSQLFFEPQIKTSGRSEFQKSKIENRCIMNISSMLCFIILTVFPNDRLNMNKLLRASNVKQTSVLVFTSSPKWTLKK